MKKSSTNDPSTWNVNQRTKVAFSIGEVGDGVAYQTFSFLIFVFYFTVVRLPVLWISAGFIIWSLWNAINDPLIGVLSDRTQSRWGRRFPWMLGATLPLAVMMIVLWIPPLYLSSDVINFAYFLFVLFLFDTFYTAFNLNYNAMWSEMFISMEDRSVVGQIRGIFVIVALIFAFVLPTIIIEDMTDQYGYSYTQSQYVLVGIVAATVIVISYSIVLKWGAKERSEFIHDSQTAPSYKEAIRYTFRNKAFRFFVIAALATWICNGILPTIIPLYATYVLHIAEEDSLLIGLLLLVAFLVGAVSMPFWTKLRQKKGARATGLTAFACWAVSLLIFMWSFDLLSGLVTMALVGLGLGGSIYFYDQCIAEIIDEDEIRLGTRRSGGYYGVISFIIRLSGVINALVIGIVFTGTEWSTYTPNPGIDVIWGLRFLVGVFPAIVLTIGFVALYFYPIHGKFLQEIRQKLTEVHNQKRTDQ
ncbi:MAG: MFS transporter [Candidatus Odinarchaeota archaeon]